MILPQQLAAAIPCVYRRGNNAPTYVGEQIVRIDHHFNDKFWIFGHWVSEQLSQT
jgi:hypothetical protein